MHQQHINKALAVKAHLTGKDSYKHQGLQELEKELAARGEDNEVIEATLSAKVLEYAEDLIREVVKAKEARRRAEHEDDNFKVRVSPIPPYIISLLLTKPPPSLVAG